MSDDRRHEPSPYVEAAADEPASWSPTFGQSASARMQNEKPSARTPSWLDEPAHTTRKRPLRFTWQMDAEGRLSLGSNEFSHLIGARTAAGFGRLWSDIAETFDLDPDGRVLRAIATRDTWTGITLNWPTDGGSRLPVELSGLPLHDGARNFAGYRGFGVCRDLDALARLDAWRRHELTGDPAPQALSADIVPPDMIAKVFCSEAAPFVSPALSAFVNSGNSQPTDLEIRVEAPEEASEEAPDEMVQETPRNVLPFRPINESRTPLLTAVENRTFHELARQLAERLEKVRPTALPPADAREASAAAMVDPPPTHPEIASQQPSWLTPPEPPARRRPPRPGGARSVAGRRVDLPARPVALCKFRVSAADGLCRSPGAGRGRRPRCALCRARRVRRQQQSDAGKPVTISATQDPREHALPATTEARLYTITWDDDSALALIFSNAANPNIPAAPDVPSPVGYPDADELGTILDTTAEGILMFDAEGNINSCNRSAEALFGHDSAELVQRNLIDLFAPESAPAVKDYLESIKGAEFASVRRTGPRRAGAGARRRI